MSSQRTRIESALTHAWLRRGPLAVALWPLSCVFRLSVALRRFMYRTGISASTRLPVPVVVVGNVFVGGTGKTPLTIWLVEVLRRAGYRPGVISRGYGADTTAPRLVDHDVVPNEVGDEPVLIACRADCPVMVGRNRVAAAKALLAAHPELDVIISDDGLQHYALRRDVEIILFDGRGVGNGWMLPAGPLRESAMRRRDFTVVNAVEPPCGMPENAFRMQLAGDVAERLGDRAQRRSLSSIRDSGVTVLAAAGIGNPARFFAMLNAAGLAIDSMPLPDHYDFADNPFAGVNADMILITEKDAVKCVRIDLLKNDPRIWVVPVTARINGALAIHIVEKLRGHSLA